MSADLSDISRISYDARAIVNAPDLDKGDEHPSIVEMQAYLTRFGYLDEQLERRGRLDVQTSLAISKFQERFGLIVSGRIDRATREAMAAPRCGLQDLRANTAANVTSSWGKRSLTFAFGTLTSQVATNVAQNAVRRAFTTWENGGVGLTFAEVRTTDRPDLQIEWRPSNDPDYGMPGNIIAHGDYPPGSSVIVSAPPLPIHFDDSHAWSDGAAANKLDIESVALHEIGHCLGFDHSTVNGAVMWPSIGMNTELRILQSDDLEGLNKLYPIKSLAVASTLSSERFLRMDGRGKFNGDGGGLVNCQSAVGPWEKFRLLPQPDGTFAIASKAFMNTFLRMDGRGSFSVDGGGIVNCQHAIGPWEKFQLRGQGSGIVAIESVAFPGVYLRMDIRGHFSTDGGGVVNCQNSIGPWEKFKLSYEI